MLKRIFSILILFFILSDISFSRPFLTIDAISGDNENIQGKISQVIQDKKGFIWFSSFNGLHKYDGYKIKKFKSDASRNSFLMANRISAISANSNDDIWCISAGRLYLFSESKEVFTDIQPMFEEYFGYKIEIKGFYPQASGYTWMVSSEGECFRVNDNAPFDKCFRFEYKQNKYSDIINITLDSKGNEWIITKKGLYRNNRLISKNRFFYLFESDDKLWISSFSGNMCVYNNADSTFTSYKMPVRPKRIYHQEFHNESLLVTASDSGLFLTNTVTAHTAQISEKEYHTVYMTSNGDFITADVSKNLFYISSDTGEVEKVTLPANVQFNDFRLYFKEDDNGLVWLVFHDTTDILYYDKDSRAFCKPDNLPAESYKVNGHLEDKQGNIWFRKDRLIQKISFNNPPFEFTNNNDNEIRAFIYDNMGRKWIGYKNQELIILDKDDKYLGHLDGLGSIGKSAVKFPCMPYAIMQDSHGVIWIGTKNHGIYRYTPTSDKNRFHVSHFENNVADIYSLSNNSVYSILEDSNSNIWIATNGGGLNLWDKGNFININNDLFQSSPDVPVFTRYIAEIKKGVIMAGAKEGLFTFDAYFNTPDEIRLYCSKRDRSEHSLTDSDIMFFSKTEKNGDIYVATNSGGLNRIKSDNLLCDNLLFDAVTKNDGLASDVALSFIEDSDGALWVLSENAISHFNPINGVIENFDASYFSDGIVFSEALPVFSDGRISFCSNKGLCSFYPSDVVKSYYTAPLEFTNLHIQNVPSFFRISKAGELSLNSEDRNIYIKFAALDFRGVSKIKYAYYLENVDKEWNVTSDNNVTYLNIPKGRHVLHIKSTNAEGVWCDNERLLTIDVEPRFFESHAGYSLISIIVLILFTVVTLLYKRFYMLNQKLSFEKQLTDIKLRFFTDISHELRTPLTLIDGPVSQVLEDKSLSPQTRRYVETVKSNTTRMLNLVNQILDFRKIQNRKMELLIVQIDPHEMMQRIADNFYELAKSHKIALSIINEIEENDSLWVDLDKFEKIFFNILSNAFKYTPDNRAIEIRISKREGIIEISVKDQGIGIARDLIPGLFSRFETVLKNNLFKSSSGIGLSLVKQYSDMHHAEITVDSTPGAGTCFAVGFRIGYSHFNGDDNVEFLASDIASENIQRPTIEQLIDKTVSDKHTVLVVEDNAELRDFVKSILIDQYNVIEACNGDEGLSLAKKHWPDMIVSDIMMPVMDGIDMLSRIKQDKDIYTIPVILLTAKSTVNDQIEGAKSGADDYIVKPFSPNYMKTKIASLINQRAALKQALFNSISDKKNSHPIGSLLEPELPQITSADEEFIEKVKSFVEVNIDNTELSMSDFADAMNMGRTTFTNKFKGILGLTPVEFVHDMRMKRSRQLLESKNFTISEVAFKSGFSDPKYFSACFKRYYGETPSNYKRLE